MHAAYQRGPGRQLLHSFRDSVPGHCRRRLLIISDRNFGTHRRPPARRLQLAPPTTAPRATASARTTQHRRRIAGVSQAPAQQRCKKRKTEVLATSAASSFRDSAPHTTLCDAQSAQADQLVEALAVTHHAVACDRKLDRDRSAETITPAAASPTIMGDLACGKDERHSAASVAP
jgi:hypothetical protein